MFDNIYITTVAMVIIVAAICVFIQKFFKRYLESDQYYYLKDITLVGAWALCGIWAADGPLKITIATGIVAACIGFCQKVSQGKNLRFLYFLVGLGFSIFGPRIAFIEFTKGEYYYLSYFASIAISTLWVGIFPIFFQEIDDIPGMAGLLLTVSWSLISVAILSSSLNLQDSSQICIAGMIFLTVFWSRHIHPYKRLTEPLTALWGTLFAGITIFGVSKGITFYTLAVMPLGIFALPIIETLLSVVTAAAPVMPTGNYIVYRNLIKNGKDHVDAINCVVRICALCGCAVSFFFFGIIQALLLSASASVILFVIYIYTKLKFAAHAKNYNRKPGLWGIRVDNISLNYAVTQVQHWINTNDCSHIIVTPDALAALRSRTDEKYRKIVREAGLVLPDGAGLIGALKLVGSPIQERIPGVEFTEHLCKRAACEGWSVWLLGGEPGIADKAADVLCSKYPGLTIAGTQDGFFKQEDTESVCKRIQESGAKILFAGLGVPKQEYWLDSNLKSTGAIVGMGIGGSMDVLSGKLTRAPKIWQKFGMEWLYRLLQEPWRWRRMSKLPVFVLCLFLTVLHIDRYKNNDVEITK